MNQLDNLSKKELAEIYNNLNRWRWDERIGPKPLHFDEMPNPRRRSPYWNKQNHIEPIMYEIKQRISDRRIFKHLHLKIIGYTWFQFEWFWIKRVFRMKILKQQF